MYGTTHTCGTTINSHTSIISCHIFNVRAFEGAISITTFFQTHFKGMIKLRNVFLTLPDLNFLFNLSRFQEYRPKMIHTKKKITAKNLDRAQSYLSGLKGFPFFPAVFPEGQRQLLAFGTVRSEDATFQNLANIEVVRRRRAFVHPQLGPWDDSCRDDKKKHST